MRIWKTLQKWLVGILVIGTLAACGGGGGSSTPAIPIAAVKWQLDGNGFARYMTNDAQQYNSGHYITYTQTNEAQMSTVTATVDKVSGAVNYGYGIVFGFQDTNNFYRLLIDAYGHYILSVKVAGVYTTLIAWTSPHNALLNSGMGASNVISVTQQSPHNFSISFNGTQETQFTDPNFTGGESGFYMSIGSATSEYFPYIPEDGRFKLTSPVAYPAAAAGVAGLESTAKVSATESVESGSDAVPDQP